MAQWVRWKTVQLSATRASRSKIHIDQDNGLDSQLTLLNAVLLGTLVVLVLLLASDTLDALVVVVLVRSALSRVGALWI